MEPDDLVGVLVFPQHQQMIPADAQQTPDDAHENTQQHLFAEPDQVFFRMLDLVKPCHDRWSILFE